MNPRTSLITATLTLSLIVPAAAGASRTNIPADPFRSRSRRLHSTSSR